MRPGSLACSWLALALGPRASALLTRDPADATDPPSPENLAYVASARRAVTASSMRSVPRYLRDFESIMGALKLEDQRRALLKSRGITVEGSVNSSNSSSWAAWAREAANMSNASWANMSNASWVNMSNTSWNLVSNASWQLARPAKVILGIFSRVEPQRIRGKHIREIIRNSWMDHPAVCHLDDITDGCVIRVVFVVGDSQKAMQKKMKRKRDKRGASWLLDEKGLLELNITENMDSGKSFAWFDYASRRYTWADYIAKCDEDVFLHVDNFLEGIDQASAKAHCPRAYLGRPWTCVDNDICPPDACGPPVNHNYWAYDKDAEAEREGRCWSYMQGGMYGMSRRVALEVTKKGGFFSKHQVGYEDMMTGYALANTYGKDKPCLYVWNSTQVSMDRMYVHLRGRNEHPGGVSLAWDRYYGYVLPDGAVPDEALPV